MIAHLLLLFLFFLVVFPPYTFAQESIKGIYYGAHVFGSRRIIEAIEKLLDTTEVNTIVIDKKDDHGNEITGESFKKLIQPFKDHNARIMCRIVVLKDNVWARKEGMGSALKSRMFPEKLWHDRKGNTYLDPAFESVANYNIDVSVRAIEDGCEIINYDYIRLPSPRDGNTADTKYLPPGSRDTKTQVETKAAIKREAMQSFLKRLVSGVRIKYSTTPLAASIFGYACYGQEPNVGQYLDDFASLGLIISCMAYPSHYSCNDEAPDPNTEPYKIYHKTISRARVYLAERGLKASFIPWLQGYDYPNIEGCGLGRDAKGRIIGIRGKPGNITRYATDPKHFRKQIKACNDLGIYSWLVWPSQAAFERTDLYQSKPRYKVTTSLRSWHFIYIFFLKDSIHPRAYARGFLVTG